MMPLNHIFRKCTAGNKLRKSQENINHLMYSDGHQTFCRKRKRIELMDQRTRKLMTMHMDLPALKTAWTQQLEDYIQKSRGRLIAATGNYINKTKTSGTTITRKKLWKEKQPYGRFKQLTSDISHEKMWTWLRKGNLKREPESLLIATQNNAIKTNHIKAENRWDATKQQM